MEGIPPDGASSSSSAVRAPPLRDEEIARILNHGREEDADSDDEDEDLVQPVLRKLSLVQDREVVVLRRCQLTSAREQVNACLEHATVYYYSMHAYVISSNK
ncbi:unnamed protein product [Arctia plantaginis]|uniref:Uncharacterized protein n=1 Tax=Arctia plantaginis TaxID=874455 RepID=A0A8S0Z2J3_ARCPL|nr:unnamed protein product [Arctia plantaginis]